MLRRKVRAETIIWCKAAKKRECIHQKRGLSQKQASNRCYIAVPWRCEHHPLAHTDDNYEYINAWLRKGPYDCGGQCYIVKY